MEENQPLTKHEMAAAPIPVKSHSLKKTLVVKKHNLYMVLVTPSSG
jgi:hypothetical protein